VSSIHKVKQDEHISGIALQHGFSDFHIVWDHPRNAKLKALRGDGHVLFPGDEVFIPDPIVKTESGQTTLVNPFVLDEPPLFLRLKVLDVNRQPIADQPYTLKLEFEGEPRSDKTDKEGLLLQEIQARTVNAELQIDHKLLPLPPDKADPKAPKPADRIEQLKFDLKIGRLNPETTLSGQQARLNNMSYFAGFDPDNLEQMQWAIEEFQCDQMNQKPVAKTPQIVPESEDPATETGVTDKATRTKIRDVHGI
jgi:hypothetical protein